MSVLKFNPSLNKFTHGKVEIEDCSFTIPATSLPCTVATAFVDEAYPNTAPYFSDYANGAAWVAAQITAGVPLGNLIITSNQTDCDLISNVNIWLAPNVTVNSFTGSNSNNINIDGQGQVQDFTLQTCNDINASVRLFGTARVISCGDIKLEYSTAQSMFIDKSNDIDIICKGTGGQFGIDGESRVNLEGLNCLFTSITINTNSSLRAKGCKVSGQTSNGADCYADFQDCEFYRATGIAIESIGEMSLTNCWVYSGDDYGIKINDGLSSPMTTIINNTMIWAGSSYSIYDNNTSGNIAPVHIYGESCSNKAMYHCDAVVRGLWSGASFKYKVY